MSIELCLPLGLLPPGLLRSPAMTLLRVISPSALFVLFVAALAMNSRPVVADDSAASPASLHAEIDRLINADCQKRGVPLAQLSSDAEFLRRVSLDLTGMIPTAAAAQVFLDDKTPDKRAKLIDRLLESPEYSFHMARVFDVVLTERRVATIRSYDVPSAKWREYLAASFRENKPWDQLVREMLASDGTDPKLGSAAKFYLVRSVKPELLTRDIGRLLLGVDLQCAQCHDDPRYDDYLQADYYGIFAFVSRLSHFRDKEKNQSLVAEKAEGKVTFTSVFTALDGKTQPRLPGGEMIPDPELDKEKLYIQKSDGGKRAIPQYSRRLQLAKQLPRSATPGFSRNIANRLWFHMMGRGLVHPLDQHHAKNPPSHPELLDLLAHRFEAMRYDIKSLLRELALSQTYQRSSLLPKGAKQVLPQSFAVAPLRALTPEQFAWSLIQATGRIPTSAKAADGSPGKENRQQVYDQRKKTYAPFVRDANTVAALFAGMAGQPDGSFSPTVDQALFLLNGDKLPVWLKANSTLVGRLAKLKTPEEIAQALYLSVLSRRPSPEETEAVRELLAKVVGDERVEALRQLVWGELLCAEFRLNH